MPTLCRRRHQHGARHRSRFAQHLPMAACTGRAARDLAAQQRHGIQFFIGRSVFDPDLIHTHIEFFREHHACPGIDTLTHFDVGHDQPHQTVRVDADESIGSERRIAVRSGGRCIARLTPCAQGGLRGSADACPQECKGQTAQL